MAVSGSIDFNQTAGEVVTEAFALIGVASEGDTLEADTMAAGILSLNMMLKTWQGVPAMRRWLLEPSTITWTAAQSDAELTPNVLDVASVVYRVGTNDRALERISRAEYNELPNKSSAGPPSVYSLTKERNTQHLWIWPVPASAATLIIDMARIINDVDASTDDLDVPQEWLEAVTHNLAVRLLTKYPGLAPADARNLKDAADRLRAELVAYGEDTASVFFSPA